jgi:hypothetical protein
MSRRLGEGEGGNREGSPVAFFGGRGDRSGANVEANSPKEGGPRGKHGFLRASEPKAREKAA